MRLRCVFQRIEQQSATPLGLPAVAAAEFDSIALAQMRQLGAGEQARQLFEQGLFQATVGILRVRQAPTQTEHRTGTGSGRSMEELVGCDCGPGGEEIEKLGMQH